MRNNFYKSILSLISLFHFGYGEIIEYTLESSFSTDFANKVNECSIDPYENPLIYKELAKQWMLESLPADLFKALLEMEARGSNALLIHNFPIDSFIPPTPRNGARPPAMGAQNIDPSFAKGFVSEAALLGLCAFMNCEPDYDEREKDGRIVSQIIPINEDGYTEQESSFGSKKDFSWHTENIYQLEPMKFFGLLCLRSDPKVATGLLCLDDILLSLQERLGDAFDSFVKEMRTSQYRMCSGNSFEKDAFGHELPILTQNESGEDVLRLNFGPERMKCNTASASYVVEVLKQVILDPEFSRKNTKRIVLKNGDFLFINNWKTLHCREGFEIDPDNWRWLQRIYLKKSAE